MTTPRTKEIIEQEIAELKKQIAEVEQTTSYKEFCDNFDIWHTVYAPEEMHRLEAHRKWEALVWKKDDLEEELKKPKLPPKPAKKKSPWQ